MKKKLAIAITFIMMLGLTACGESDTDEGTNEGTEESTEESTDENLTDETDSDDKVLGMLSISLSQTLAVNIETGIQQAADENGYELISIETLADPEAELAGIETMKSSGVQAFYTITANSSMIYDNVQELAPGMGMLSHSGDEDSSDAYVKEDNIGMTNMFVESLDAFMEENGLEEVSVGFLWIEGCDLEDTSNYEKRIEILEELDVLLDGRDDISIAVEYICSDNDEAAITNCESLLNAYPDTTVLFCYNEDIAIKSANTIMAAVTDCSDYYIFSSESNEESINMINDDSSPLRACADYDQEALGYEIGMQLINWAENGTMENVIVKKTLVDWRNIKDYTE